MNFSAKYDTKKFIASLEGAKSLTDTLNMEIDISVNTENDTNLITDSIENKATITLNERFYPLSPDEATKKYIESYNDFLKLKSNLAWKKEDVKREILSDYLHLLRLKEMYEIDKLNYDFFKKVLSETETLYNIKEIDKAKLYTAQINLKDAAYILKEDEINFNRAEREFYNFLGLPDGYSVIFKENNPYINKIQKKLKGISEDIVEFLPKLKNIHPDLVSYKLDLKLMDKKIQWVKDEAKPKLNLKADYDFLDGDFGIIYY